MSRVISNNQEFILSGNPDKCPYCHNIISPVNLFAYPKKNNALEVLMRCPNQDCEKSFIAYYSHDYSRNFGFTNQTSKGDLSGKDFSESINRTSPSFIKIYNEAFCAEQQDLTEICGVGYRKSLEFLIKDYIIFNNLEKRETVEKKLLSACINEHINNKQIKSVAKRAAWLGNDETHYIRKWEGLNLTHLKTLIDLTVHWIEMESLTKDFETEMPE